MSASVDMKGSVAGATLRPVSHWGRLAAMLALAGLLAACAGTGGAPGKRAGSGADDADPAAGPGAVARAPARGGGYYLDDGPGDAPPPDLDAIPDAVPRAEPVRERNSRPYTIFGRQYRPMTQIEPYRERGVATWYGRRYHGNATSSGERYDMYAMTAAHPTLPIPSYVRVTNLDNQRSVVVRVNDRGPFLHDRLIDLSYTAAAKLGYVDKGSARVEVELITEFGEPSPTPVAEAASGVPTAAVGVTGVPLVAAAAREPERLTMTRQSDVGSGQTGTAESPTGPAAAAGAPSAPERLQVSTELRGQRNALAATRAAGASAAVATRAETVHGPGLHPVSTSSSAGSPAHAESSAHAGSMTPPASPGATPVPLLERGHWLQIGAFGSADNADAARERLADELTRLGAPLDVVAEGGLFKLQAGPWPTREAARAAADRVRAQSGLQSFPIER